MKTKKMWVFDAPRFRRIKTSIGWWFLQDFADEQKEKADAAFKDGEYRRVPQVGYLSQNKRFSLHHLVFGGCFMPIMWSPKPWNR